MTRKPPDVEVTRLPVLTEAEWQNAGEVLALLYDRAEERARTVSNWYLADRRGKRLASRSLRVVAIVLATGGAMVPLVQEAVDWLDPMWGYAILLLAGSAIGFDKVFGLSSAWMRDMLASQKVQILLTDLQHDWLAFRTGLGTQDADAMLVTLRTFNQQLALVMSSETDEWAREFDAVISDLDDLVSRRSR